MTYLLTARVHCFETFLSLSLYKLLLTMVFDARTGLKRYTRWEQFRLDVLDYICAPATAGIDPNIAHGAATDRPEGDSIKIVCISDTHGTTPFIPEGDVLIHAGDLTNGGTFREVQAQLDWLATQPHAHKLLIGGNHDLVMDPSCWASHPRFDPGGSPSELEWHDVTYLRDTLAVVSVRGRELRVFGSPHTPAHGKWAFQYPRDCEISGLQHYQIPTATLTCWSRTARLWDIPTRDWGAHTSFVPSGDSAPACSSAGTSTRGGGSRSSSTGGRGGRGIRPLMTLRGYCGLLLWCSCCSLCARWRCWVKWRG